MTLTCRDALTRAAKAAGIVTLGLPLAGIASFEALFAPKAELWPRWQTHDPAATAVIDHAAWGEMLKTYLHTGSDGINRFDYAAVSDDGRQRLDSYIESLAAIPIDGYARDEQLAYWINLYNALTVRVILDHYPVDGIRDIDISPGLFADGPWDKALVAIEGEALTLNDIEHRIIRPIWNDPRIHYAVNCAAIGCPNLQAMPFTGATVDALMETAARDYVNSPRGVRRGERGLIVSSIYTWFEEDFGSGDDDIIAHVRPYADPELTATLAEVDRISGYDYDWSLNDYRRDATQSAS